MARSAAVFDPELPFRVGGPQRPFLIVQLPFAAAAHISVQKIATLLQAEVNSMSSLGAALRSI
jgi:hypothetical protein